MVNRKRVLVLAVLILLVDTASARALFERYRDFEDALSAGIVAIAFAALQIGALWLFSQPLPPRTRGWLLAGVACLFSVTALANVAGAYMNAREAFPAAALQHAVGFGLGERGLTVAASYAFGLALPLVGLIFWAALGRYLHEERERAAETSAALREAVEALRREGH